MKQRKQIIQLLRLLKLVLAMLVVVAICSSSSSGRSNERMKPWIWMVSAQQQGGIASSIIATILDNLQRRGFMTAATILALLPRTALNNIVPPMTLLIPTDASLANISSIPPTTYPNLLRYHILHGAFTFDQLKLLPVGTLIPTFLSPQNGVLVTANSASQFALDGVPVASPNICPGVTGSSIACQGISSLLNPSAVSGGTPTFAAPAVSPVGAPGPAVSGAVPVPAPAPVPSPTATPSSVPAPSPSTVPPSPSPASAAPPPASPPPSGVGLAGSAPSPAAPPPTATTSTPPPPPTAANAPPQSSTTPAPPPPPGAGSSSVGSRLQPMTLHWMVAPLVLLLLGAAAALGDAQPHHR